MNQLKFFVICLLVAFSYTSPVKAQSFPEAVPCSSSEQQIIAQQQYTLKWASEQISNSLLDQNDPLNAEALRLSKRWFGTSKKSFLLELAANFRLVSQVGDKLGQPLCVAQNNGQFVEEIKKAAGWVKVDGAPDTIAYVYKEDISKNVYYMPAFFSLAETGYDSLSGTIVHEVLHFDMVASLDDHEYGKTAALNLAKKKNGLAKKNADNYQYFFEELLKSYIDQSTIPNFASIDKAKDSWPVDEEYWMIFLSRDYVPGHAFVVWGVRDRITKSWKTTQAYGAYPREIEKKIAFGSVPGVLVGKSVDNLDNANDGLAVAVTKAMYDYSFKNTKIISKYPDDYNLYRQNCVQFTDLIAKSIGLETPQIENLSNHPVRYIAELRLKNLN